MRCWRIDLRRSFLRYLDGELDSDKVKRIETHLLDCGPCRTSLARLRSGHRFASQMPRFKPQRDPWDAIEAAIETQDQDLATTRPAAARLIDRLRASVRKPAFGLGAVAALAIGLLIAQSLSAREFADTDDLDRGEFAVVSIADIDRNTKPHIVAEGFVSQVNVNDEDGDLSFKIVESLHQTEPFIVCEIIDPIKFKPPQVGSRVRVYGVSRYDGQVNHNWYEVHPVLNIEVVR